VLVELEENAAQYVEITLAGIVEGVVLGGLMVVK